MNEFGDELLRRMKRFTEQFKGSEEMSREKHTPGPWHAICHAFGKTEIWEVIAGQKADTVVQLSLFRVNQEADAKLIAAAPELLDACKLALKDMGAWGIHGPGRTAIEAAIKKAVGELDRV